MLACSSHSRVPTPRAPADALSGSEVAENCFTSFITPKLREVFIRQSIKIKVQKNNA